MSEAKLFTWDEIWAPGNPSHDAIVGPYRIGIFEHNLLGYPVAAVAFFRQDVPGKEGEWVFCSDCKFTLPPYPENHPSASPASVPTPPRERN